MSSSEHISTLAVRVGYTFLVSATKQKQSTVSEYGGILTTDESVRDTIFNHAFIRVRYIMEMISLEVNKCLIL